VVGAGVGEEDHLAFELAAEYPRSIATESRSSNSHLYATRPRECYHRCRRWGGRKTK